MDLPRNTYFTFADPLVAAAGGAGCQWVFGEQGDPNGAEVEINAVPASIAGPGEVVSSESGVPGCDPGPDLTTSNSGCHLAGTVHGWWYDGYLFIGTSAERQQAAMAPVLSSITTALDRFDAPSVPNRRPVACVDADMAIDPSGRLGQGALAVHDTTTPPDPRAGLTRVAAARVSGESDCWWGEPLENSFGFGVTFLPGSIAPYDTCVSRGGGAVVSLPGVTKAESFPYDEGLLKLCATDGVSSIELQGDALGVADDPMWDGTRLGFAAQIVGPALKVASR